MFCQLTSGRGIGLIKDLFANLCIIMSFTYVINYIMSHSAILPRSAFVRQWIAGISGGLLGTLLMVYSVKLDDTLILDLRALPLILIAFIFGPLPALIASVLIGIGRIIFFDLNTASLSAGVNVVLIALVCGWLSTLRLKPYTKLVWMTLYTMLQTSALIYWLMPEPGRLFWVNLVPVFWFASCLGVFVFYNFYYHLRSTNDAMRKLRTMVTRDFLTGTGNARHFDAQALVMFKRANREALPLSLLIIDIDFFKQVNDTYGHAAGDAVLKQLVTLLERHARPQDTVSRNGGEEFSLLLADLDIDASIAIAEQIRSGVASYPFELPDGTSIQLTISIGVSSFPSHAKNLNDLVQRADEALYRAKDQGRNRVCE